MRSFVVYHCGRMEAFPSYPVWNPWISLRVRFFAWENGWGRILVVDQLKRRGWKIPNRCNMCIGEVRNN